MSESTASLTEGTRVEFRASNALSTTLSIFSRRWLTFCLIAALVALPYDVTSYFNETKAEPRILFLGLDFMASVLVPPICAAIILHAAFQDLRGRPVQMGLSIAIALGRILPLLVLAILAALGEIAGFVLLIFPGMFLMVAWSVAIPVCILEQRGPSASLARSYELTEGNRWKLFGVYALLIIVAMLGAGAIAAGVAAVWPQDVIGGMAVVALWMGIVDAFQAVLIAVIYRELRTAKEGVDIEQIAAVFN
jgi:hypothetical protein